jgi:hypothetical protein
MFLKNRIFPLLVWAIFIFGSIQKCPSDDTLCLLCAHDECLVCSSSFKKDKVCQKPTVQVSNCATYIADGICEICKFGFYKDSNGLCQEITIKNCLTIDLRTFECTSCSNGILVSKGKCEGADKCSIKDCEVCGLNGTTEICGKCRSGFAIKRENSKAECIADNEKTANCMLLGPDNDNTCLMCNYNSYYSRGLCPVVKEFGLDVSVKSIGTIGCLCTLIILAIFI